MYKKILLLLFFIVFYQSNSFSQTTTISASVKVLRPLSLSTVGTNHIDFGDLLVSPGFQYYYISDDNGQKFLAQGEANRSITVSYTTTVEMSNHDWVTQYGGTEGTLYFTPFTIHSTGKLSTYTGAVEVQNGDAVTLVSDNGVGKSYFWVGGYLWIFGSQPAGFYKGPFVLTVAY